MKFLSPPNILVVLTFMIGLVACGAAAPSPGSKESTAFVPPPPPPPPPPPLTEVLPPDEVFSRNNDADKGILGPEELKPESDLVAAKPDGREKDQYGAPTDPLAPPGFGGSEGGMSKPRGSGIASNAKGAQHGATTGATGNSEPSGTTVGAATEVRGSIDKSEIQRVVRLHINDVKRCYDQGLSKRPDLEGKVVLKFTIGKTGTVIAAKVEETTLSDRPVEQCITSAALRWSFPKPTGEGLVVISYPFILKSAN